MSVWRPVGPVNFRHFHVARLQAHYAAQWLARAARAYVGKKPDDSHTNLGWDDAFGGLTTHPLPDGSRIGLRLADLTLAVLGSTPKMLALDGRADADVRAWLGAELTDRGLDAGRLDAPAPYTIPEHVIAVGARYSLDELRSQFEALSTWYANADGLLGRLRDQLAARKLKGPAVRCWPHHFDLDSAVPFSKDHGKDRGMALGFSPGDDYCDEPYFYVTMWPEPKIPELPLLPPQGHWHSYEFLAALAPAHKIVVAADQGAYVEAFFDVAVEAAIRALR
jgi:hypothetical protein